MSIVVALAGIGLATFFFLKNRRAADSMAARFAGLHRLLEHKYYVDEIYDAAIVQPIRIVVGGRLVEGRGRARDRRLGERRRLTSVDRRERTVAPSCRPVRFACTRRRCFSGSC